MSNASSELAKLHHPSLGPPWQVVLNTVGAFLFSQLIAVFLVSIGYGLTHPHTHNTADAINNSIAAQFFFVLLAEGLAALFTIWLVRRRGLNLGAIGLGRRPRIMDARLAVLGFLSVYALLVIANLIIGIFSPQINNQKQNLGFNNISTGSQNILAFLALVIVPPLGEEPLVRGFLYSGLRRWWRFWPAALATSFLFGIAHLEFGSGGPLVWGAAIDTFLLSIILVFLRERTGALYAGMAVHMLNNLIAFFVVIK